MTARRHLATALSLAVLVVGSLIAAGPAAAATRTATATHTAAATRTKVIEFNAADGKACKTRCLAPVAGLLAHGVDVIALQEVCLNDLTAFAAAHHLHDAFSAQSTADTHCGGTDRGNALLSRHALRRIGVYPLSAPHTRTKNTFTLLCATVRGTGTTLRGCSTHLVAGKSPDQAGQVKQIIAATAAARKAGAVVVAGDFNMTSNNQALAPMRRSFSQKHPSDSENVNVEYVWFHSKHVSGLTTRGYGGGTSDHGLLLSSAGL